MGSDTWIFIVAAYSVGAASLGLLAMKLVWQRKRLRDQERLLHDTPGKGA